jgi:N-acetyltransferase 10
VKNRGISEREGIVEYRHIVEGSWRIYTGGAFYILLPIPHICQLMVKKRVDDRIISIIEQAVRKNHRAILIIVGKDGKRQIQNVHYLLSRSRAGQQPSILWCHKNEVWEEGKKRRGSTSNNKGNPTSVHGEESDSLRLFLAQTGIHYVNYNENDRVLGNTYGMLVLQDYEAVTPNILARTIETVQGGGIITFLLNDLSLLEANSTFKMDVHKKYGGTCENRFNLRLFKSLVEMKSTIIMYDSLDVLPISRYSLGAKVEEKAIPKMNWECRMKTELVDLCKTEDQINTFRKLEEILREKSTRTIASITTARGREKSSVLGLSISKCISLQYSTIFVASPSIENVGMLFEFVLKGLNLLGYAEKTDYKVVYAMINRRKFISEIIIQKTCLQPIKYMSPSSDLRILPDILVVDAAAAIPLPILKEMLRANLVFMASTVGGYEGTGRSLSLKLFDQLRKESKSSEPFVFKELTLTESIRYDPHDKVEKWLNKALLLDCAPLQDRNMPSPLKVPFILRK